jgi:CDGSH-type Zn-finger protein/predicted regulator of Ras-like GTPase activity (Roadblock/LC7/MglB family)
MGFPQLIEEDFQRIDAALKALLAQSEASAAMLVEKAGHLIQQRGLDEQFPPDVLATLASNAFNAVQFMAGLLQEDKFPGMYQQGEKRSTLMLNVDENCIVVIIFPASVSVGAVRFYAAQTIEAIANQIKIAQARAPTVSFDLTDLDVENVQQLFQRKASAGQTAPASEAAPAADEAAVETATAAAVETPAATPPTVPPEPPAAAPAVEQEPAPAVEPAPVQAAEPAPAVVEPPEPEVPAEPVMAKRGPYIETVTKGVYWWCSCGRSKKQPFCDGSHKGTGLKPLEVDVQAIKRIAFCGCKRTKNAPFCDGTHSKLPRPAS